MRKHWAVKGLLFVVCATLAVALFGFVTLGLWNWLMPSLFSLPAIGFWQALGLLVLSRLLLGGFRGRGAGHMHWRRRMFERWERMTPEEREKFRQGMRGRCGHSAPPASEAPSQ